MTIDRLYGIGSEQMFLTPLDVYDEAILDDETPGVVVEEWDVHPPGYHLPKAETVLEDIAERVADFGEVTEGVYDHWERATKSLEVVMAMQNVLDLIASKVEGRMARRIVDHHSLTLSDDRTTVLWDGEPLQGAKVRLQSAQL